jgi:hypothetical protein
VRTLICLKTPDGEHWTYYELGSVHDPDQVAAILLGTRASGYRFNIPRPVFSLDAYLLHLGLMSRESWERSCAAITLPFNIEIELFLYCLL